MMKSVEMSCFTKDIQTQIGHKFANIFMEEDYWLSFLLLDSILIRPLIRETMYL